MSNGSSGTERTLMTVTRSLSGGELGWVFYKANPFPMMSFPQCCRRIAIHGIRDKNKLKLNGCTK